MTLRKGIYTRADGKARKMTVTTSKTHVYYRNRTKAGWGAWLRCRMETWERWLGEVYTYEEASL